MGGLRAEGDAEGVDVDLCLDRLGGDVGQVAGDQDSGVVVEDVETAVGVRGEVGQRVGPLLRLADVELAGDEVRVLRLRGGEGVVADVVDPHGPALAGEALGRRQTDAGGTSGDEDR